MAFIFISGQRQETSREHKVLTWRWVLASLCLFAALKQQISTKIWESWMMTSFEPSAKLRFRQRSTSNKINIEHGRTQISSSLNILSLQSFSLVELAHLIRIRCSVQRSLLSLQCPTIMDKLLLFMRIVHNQLNFYVSFIRQCCHRRLLSSS